MATPRDAGDIVEASATEKRVPAIVVRSASAERRYILPSGSHLMVADGQKVAAGEVLVKIPRAEAGQFLRPDMGAVVTFFNEKK